MKKIFNLSRTILGTGLLLLAMNSCKNTPKQVDSKEVAENINGTKSDYKLLDEAASIKLSEIEIGKLELMNGSSPDVKKFAETLLADHKKSLSDLKMLASEKTITIPASVNSKGRQEYDSLSIVSGAEFDKKFIDIMTEGHNKAIDKMTEISQKATDDDIKDWASEQIALLTSHYQQAKKLQQKMDSNT
jgi:putative membrane protein